MTIRVPDRLRFASTTSGTADFGNGSAATGYIAPSAIPNVADGDQFYYLATDFGSNWEIGLGTYHSGAATTGRPAVPIQSSNAGAQVSFPTAPIILGIIPGEILAAMPVPNYFTGLTLSTAGGSSSFGVATGAANDSTNNLMMVLATAYTKTTSSWAVGNNNGSLDTGTISNNTWYHAYLIKRLDTNVTDILTSLSSSAPTLPSGYTVFRRIGSMRTDGSGHWIPFIQTGKRYRWFTPLTDYQNIPGVTTAISLTLTVPTGIIVQPDMIFGGNTNGAGGNEYGLFTSLNEVDTVPSVAMYNIFASGIYADGPANNISTLSTNSSGQIRARCNSTDLAIYAFTCGWLDSAIEQGK